MTNTVENLGHNIKIETHSKTENILTEDDINNSDLIILAIDKEIDLSRFWKKSKDFNRQAIKCLKHYRRCYK